MNASPTPGRIALNFLAIAPSDFSYEIFRRELSPTGVPIPGTRALPREISNAVVPQSRVKYHVCLEPKTGYEILAQALTSAPNKRLVAVTFRESQEKDPDENFREYVYRQLNLSGPHDPKLVVQFCTAKEFLEQKLTLDEMSKHFPAEESLFEDLDSKDERSRGASSSPVECP